MQELVEEGEAMGSGMKARYHSPADMWGRGTGPWGTWMPGNGLHAKRDFLCQSSVCVALDGSHQDGSEMNTKGHMYTHTHTHTRTHTHSGLQRFLSIRSEGLQLPALPQTDRQRLLWGKVYSQIWDLSSQEGGDRPEERTREQQGLLDC